MNKHSDPTRLVSMSERLHQQMSLSGSRVSPWTSDDRKRAQVSQLLRTLGRKYIEERSLLTEKPVVVFVGLWVRDRLCFDVVELLDELERELAGNGEGEGLKGG